MQSIHRQRGNADKRFSILVLSPLFVKDGHSSTARLCVYGYKVETLVRLAGVAISKYTFIYPTLLLIRANYEQRGALGSDLPRRWRKPTRLVRTLSSRSSCCRRSELTPLVSMASCRAFRGGLLPWSRPSPGLPNQPRKQRIRSAAVRVQGRRLIQSCKRALCRFRLVYMHLFQPLKHKNEPGSA